jgi:hypothetical protein
LVFLLLNAELGPILKLQEERDQCADELYSPEDARDSIRAGFTFISYHYPVGRDKKRCRRVHPTLTPVYIAYHEFPCRRDYPRAAPRDLLHPARKDVVHPNELGHESIGWLPIYHLRWRNLMDPAFIHDGNSVGHCKGFGLVVGDVHKGDSKTPLQSPEFALHANF